MLVKKYQKDIIKVMIYLKNKLYTSEEVSEIIGVTSRTLYRYVKNGSIRAETRTASGTLRFTREEIYRYLYPKKYKQIIKVIQENEKEENSLYDIINNNEKSKQNVKLEPIQKNIKNEEQKISPKANVSKFKENENQEHTKELSKLLKSLEEDNSKQTNKVEDITQKDKPDSNPKKSQQEEWLYYVNENKSIIDLAKEINNLSTETQRKYAATMYGGLSLHHDIPEFTIVHFYIKDTELDWWVNELELRPTKNPKEANICLIPTKNNNLFEKSYKLRGLYVVDNERLKNDLISHGEEALAKTVS